MSFPRYPEYKNSGVEWVGAVPAHWTVCGTGHRLQSPPCYGVLVPDFDPDGVPMLKIMDLANGVPDRSALTTISGSLSDEFQRTIVRPGDVVLSVVGTIGTVLVVPEALDGINLSRALARLLPNRDLLPQWLVWIFSSDNFTRFVDLVCVGSAQRVLNMDDLRSFRAPFPPIEEQTAIATFLDRETAKIDALVAEQEKLIALLQEKRQAVISHAVTKGLDPNVPMKDSSMEWLGEVPDHWEVRSISSISTKITNGYVGPTRDILVDDGVRYLQSLHIKRNKIRFDHQPYFVREDWSLDHRKSILEVGDVLIVQTGDIGQVAVVPQVFAGCNCHALIIVSPIRDVLSGDWLSSVLNSDYGFHSLLSIQTGALHPHLNCGNVKFLVVPVPPRHEQDAIQNYIEERTKRFDALIGEAEVAINLLQERRTALISAAVTGQIDVRGLVGGQCS